MDEKSLIYLVLVMIGLWAGLIGIRFLVVWLQLMRMRFAPGDIFRADRSAMPAEVAAILDPMFDRLAALGFAYEETFLAQPMLRYADAQPVWIDVHAHAPSGSRASVQISESPEPGFVAAVSFSTDYEQTMLQTENRRLHLLLPVPDACQLADAAAATLAQTSSSANVDTPKVSPTPPCCHSTPPSRPPTLPPIVPIKPPVRRAR